MTTVPQPADKPAIDTDTSSQSPEQVYGAGLGRFTALRDQFNRQRYLAANLTVVLFFAVPACLAIAVFALFFDAPVFVALALLFAAGFLELSFFAMAQTLVQLHAPPEMRGRVIGVFSMSAMGLRAFSGVTVGVGGSLIGIHWSLALSAGVLFVLLALGPAIATRWRS
jgi:MFS family permease